MHGDLQDGDVVGAAEDVEVGGVLLDGARLQPRVAVQQLVQAPRAHRRRHALQGFERFKLAACALLGVPAPCKCSHPPQECQAELYVLVQLLPCPASSVCKHLLQHVDAPSQLCYSAANCTIAPDQP